MTPDAWLVIISAILGAALAFIAGRGGRIGRALAPIGGVAVAVLLTIAVINGATALAIVAFGATWGAAYAVTLRRMGPCPS